MSPQVTAPKLQALILADHVYIDRASNKHVIAGTFNELIAQQLPHYFERRAYAYISITGLRGPVDLELKYVDLQDLRVLMATEPATVDVDDPHRTAEFVVEVPTFPMPHRGAYEFQMYANGDLLGSVRITVSLMSEHKRFQDQGGPSDAS